jgi:hypothetical protein
VEIISPRRVLAKIKEKVKRSVAKRIMKNRGTMPKIPGSTK